MAASRREAPQREERRRLKAEQEALEATVDAKIARAENDWRMSRARQEASANRELEESERHRREAISEARQLWDSYSTRGLGGGLEWHLREITFGPTVWPLIWWRGERRYWPPGDSAPRDQFGGVVTNEDGVVVGLACVRGYDPRLVFGPKPIDQLGTDDLRVLEKAVGGGTPTAAIRHMARLAVEGPMSALQLLNFY